MKTREITPTPNSSSCTWRRREKPAYLRHLFDHVAAHQEALRVGARRDEGSRCLHLQVPGHLPEGFVLLSMFDHAVQVLVCDVVLGVQQLEEPLQQPCPELIEGLLQVDVGAAVIAAQLAVQVLEHLRILSVQFSVHAWKGIVQGLL